MTSSRKLAARTDPGALLVRWWSTSTARLGILAPVLVCCVGVVAVAIVFRHQIANGFSFLNGDRYDQVIEISILEHWYNVFRGLASWQATGYFYPVGDTLGYNDGYFLFGCFYSLFRFAGADPYLGAELVNICLSVIGFFSFYAAARDILSLRVAWALLAASLFTLTNNLFVQAHHGQLFAICLAPLLAWLLYWMISALRDGRSRNAVGWGAAAALLYGAFLLSAYYMAWFFLFYACFALAAYLLIEGRGAVWDWARIVRREKAAIGIVGLLAFVCAVPFLLVYLPKAHETGMHTYSDALFYSPSPLDLFSVGYGNLLYGSLVAAVDHVLRPGFPAFGEQTSGFPPVLVFLFGCGAVAAWRQHRSSGSGRHAMLLAFSIAAVATWICTVHIRSVSLWWLIFKAFPGARGIRTVARYQIFLAIPVIAIACTYLAQQSGRVPRAILGLLSVLLLVGEINTASTQDLDRWHELARLASVPAPPSECRAFFVSAPRPQSAMSYGDKIYSHNVDAMLIAETRHLPTLNGFATFTPPGWALIDTASPKYLPAVRQFAQAHHVTGLCGLDLRTMRWSTDPLTGIEAR